MTTAVKVEGLTKKFGDFIAVDNVNMSIPKNVVYGFLGPNGSGKTTAIRMMCGLLAPTAGKMWVLGMRIPEQTEAVRLQVGYMTQRFSMYGDLTVEQNLVFIGKIMGVVGPRLKTRVQELIAQFHLSSFSKNLAGSLSGGQKRRLALAAATIHRPRLLLLDEPTSEVDPNTRGEFWDQLFGMCEEGTTVLVTTHLMDEAERCHNLAIINEGKKVADGTPKDLKKGLGAKIVEISGPGFSTIKKSLGLLKPVISTTQVGLVLRVMVESDLQDSVSWLKGQLPQLADIAIRRVQPSIEDVFVMATRNSKKM